MYVKIDGQLKSIKRIELMTDSPSILLHTETETGTEEVSSILVSTNDVARYVDFGGKKFAQMTIKKRLRRAFTHLSSRRRS